MSAMNIARIVLPVGAGLSPMAGVTDITMRLLAREMGAAFSVSEMLSAKGYIYAGGDNRAIRALTARAPQEGISGLQLFGSEPRFMREAAARLSDSGFSFIDINMGCPAPKITGNGEGSALMKTPLLAARVIEATVAGSRLPVTVKIRAGWDAEHQNAVEMARICQESGACAVTVHPRTRDQMYAGRADRSVIARVKQAVSIPVMGNGDITSGSDALDMLRETGCDGVLVGRAAQGNPWIFREIACAMRGLPYIPPTRRERIYTAMRHMDMLAVIVGERTAALEMRRHVCWYVNSARLRVKVNQTRSAEELRQLLWQTAQEEAADR